MRTSRPARRSTRVLALLTILTFVSALMPAIPVVAATQPVVLEPISDTWYVSAAAVTAGTGSVLDPFRSISSALAVAGSGDVISVAPGTYGAYETFPLEITGDWIDIRSTGGSAKTIINGGGAPGPLVYAWDAGFSLEGFTIKGAVVPEFGLERTVSGGGLAIESCEADLIDLVLTQNVAWEGAGLYVYRSDVHIEDSTISDNGAYPTGLIAGSTTPQGEPLPIDGTISGGGVAVSMSYLEMDDCTVSRNKAGHTGAGIDAYETELEVYDSVIDRNSLSGTMGLTEEPVGPWDAAVSTQADGIDYFDGAGVYGDWSHLDFENTEFTANVGNYGAVAADYSELLLIDSKVTGHSGFAQVGTSAPPSDFGPFETAGADQARAHPADRVAGESGSSSTAQFMEIRPYTNLEGTLFTDNTADTLVNIYGGELWVENCFFYGNDVAYPTLAMEDTYADINYSTLYGNDSMWGLWCVGPYSDVWVTGSIIWDGQANDSDFRPRSYGPSIMWSGDLELYYDDLKSYPEYIGDEMNPNAFYTDWGVIYEDPRFMDAANEDFRLALGSPCVDAADLNDDDYAAWGDYAGNSRPVDGDGDGEALWDMGALEYVAGGRLSGQDRYLTAVQVVEQNFDFADTVVIAAGEQFPDGLSASALCGVYDAPLLLTPGRSLHSAVAAEIQRLEATRAFIVGGTNAVSPAVEASLKALGLTVTRIGGANRYETSSLVAKHVIANTEFDGRVFIARGDQFADALAVAPIAYAHQIPVLLVYPNRLPVSTVDVLYNYGITNAAVLGGGAAVTTQVEGGMQRTLGVVTERIGGANRYDTAALISEWAYANSLASFETVGLATGATFPDALCGGPGLGAAGGVLLLTASDSLSAPVAASLAAHDSEVEGVQFLGGTKAISEAVKTAVYTVLGW